MLALTPHRVSVDSGRKWSMDEVKKWTKTDVINWLTAEDVSSEAVELLTETCLIKGKNLLWCTPAILLETFGPKQMLQIEMAVAWEVIKGFQKELSDGGSGTKN